jgi:excisionase family DNA binding protein
VLLTKAQVAAELKVHPRTVQRLVARGELTPIRIPGTTVLRFDADDVKELVDRGRARADPAPARRGPVPGGFVERLRKR